MLHQTHMRPGAVFSLALAAAGIRMLFMKRMIRVALVLVLLGGTSSACLADIRPDILKERTSAENSETARRLLMAAASRQGSREAWLSQSAVRVLVTDEWEPLPNAVANSWPKNPSNMEFIFIPGADDSVLHFLDESFAPTGLTWGIHDWNTWKREKAQAEPHYVSDSKIKFALPTMQYFIELAQRLPDGEIVDYAGTRSIAGTEYDVVYVTWGDYAAQPNIDQYVAYIDKGDGLVKIVDFTVRDNAGFVTAAAVYKDFRELPNGMSLAHRIDITDLGDYDSLVHQYSLVEVETNYDLPASEYKPDAERGPGSKY